MATPRLLAPLATLFAEERVPDPPERVWRDWPLVTALMVTALVETLIRASLDHLGWPIASLIVCWFGIGTLMWRRSHPLQVLLASLAAFDFLAIPAYVAGVDPSVGLFTGAYVLILFYSLFRWGSGREAAIGCAVMAVVMAIDLVTDFTGFDEAIGGAIILCVPAELGAVVRYRRSSHAGKVDKMRLQERERLARELHDTVAHHVSAIAVQAQAGRAVAATDPDAAVNALAIIEEEASRTLAELRLMVGSLRDAEDADFAPQRGVADIAEFARNGPSSPRVDVELHGQLDELRPSVQAAIYRLAQESITNALRHARHASRVKVSVVGDHEFVHLVVHDDGVNGPLNCASPPGFGLAGMSERAKLLGGRFEAGPSPEGGWKVSAVLPSSGTIR